MSRFSFPMHQQPARVTFGTGSVRSLAEMPLDERTIVFATGQASVLTQLTESLSRKALVIDVRQMLTKPAGEPDRSAIEAGAEFLRARGLEGIDRIVGIGGGSVMDWCRLAWAAAAGVLDLETGKAADAAGRPRPSIWLVPTTCATGAEAASVAVYTDRGRKVPVVSPAFLADRVVLDGQFLRHQSAAIMANSLGDALTHAIEAYVSIVPGTLAKEAAVSALALILNHAGTAASSSRNERLMEAGFLAGLAASNCSVGVVHAFAHSVASFGVPHGYACAAGLDAGLEANSSAPALMDLARRAGFSGVAELRTATGKLLAGIDAGASGASLSKALADPAECAVIAARMSADVCLRTNPTPLAEPDLASFLARVRERLSAVEAR